MVKGKVYQRQFMGNLGRSYYIIKFGEEERCITIGISKVENNDTAFATNKSRIVKINDTGEYDTYSRGGRITTMW